MTRGAIDRLLDATVVPGFSALGYRARAGGWESTPDLGHVTALVTGASSGLGAATCELLAGAGARVEMLVRDPRKGEEVRQRIAQRADGELLRLWQCDLASLSEVRAFASRFAADGPPITALVNNAGAMPAERARSADGFELTFATNVLGPFLLTGLLLPALQAARPARIVNVSSGGMYTAKLDAADPQLERREYDPPRFYAHSKRCEVILTRLWQRRLTGTGISAHSTHPGWADTPGVQASLPRFSRVMGPLLRDARQGADTIAWLCWAPEPEADPGRFWHDRSARPEHRVPWTRESPADAERLWDACVRMSDWDQAELRALAAALD